MTNIKQNLLGIQRNIDTSKVKIIAVTKYVTENEIIEAYKTGIRDFAESKAQDAEVKRTNLPEEIEKEIIWHFIGHLQTNKVKKVIGKYGYIHSLDSIKLAKQISKEAQQRNIEQKVLIQINISGEKTKYGFNSKEIKEVFKEIAGLDSLKVVGLMTMAEHTQDEEQLHATFKELRELRDNLEKENNCVLPELSMGMSNDYTIAAQEGATMIRLGSTLFK